MCFLKQSILFGCLLCGLLTGCAIWPYNEKHVVAVRTENGTNIVEKMIQSDTGWASWALLKPCYVGPDVSKSPVKYTYYLENRSGRRTKIESLTFLKKHDLFCRRNYDLFPVTGTNVWLALQHSPSRYRQDTRPGGLPEYDISFSVYAFNAGEIVRQRTWKGQSWIQGGTNADFTMDASNRRVTYFTAQGFETYDLLQDTVSPSGRRP